MNAITKCPSCGTDWSGGQTCEDDFHQFGYWELEYLLYDVHHLMVPCYYLQHPHLMSPEWVKGAPGMVAAFLEEGVRAWSASILASLRASGQMGSDVFYKP